MYREHKEMRIGISSKITSSMQNFGINQKASVGIGMIIGYFIMAILIAAFVPSTIATLIGVNTTAWGATEVTIYGTFTIFIMTGIMYMIIPKDLLKSTL